MHAGEMYAFLYAKFDFVHQSDNMVVEFSGTSRTCAPQSYNFTVILRALETPRPCVDLRGFFVKTHGLL